MSEEAPKTPKVRKPKAASPEAAAPAVSPDVVAPVAAESPPPERKEIPAKELLGEYVC